MDNQRVDGRGGVDVTLVRRLISAQFPQWAGLPIRTVANDGWDNRTYHLGDDMSVRLPSSQGYVEQVEKEHTWLPILAPQLPLPIPVPLAKGQPGEGYPHPWSVYQWIAGETASTEEIADLPEFAAALADFLNALQRADATGGPLPGAHNGHRGGPVAHYDDQTRRSIKTLQGQLDTALATEIWDAAMTNWEDDPVWIHGDIATGNLLVNERGKLSAIIDFGTSGIGDPACDLVITWTFFTGDARKFFRNALPLDEATWARARGWALWKALIGLAAIDDNDRARREGRYVIDQVFADYLESR